MPEIKAGGLTTEYKVTLIGLISGLVMSILGILVLVGWIPTETAKALRDPVSEVISAIGGIIIIATGGTYTVARTILKSKN